MSEERRELKNIIEAALLVAGQPLTVERMAAMFPEDSRPAREDIRAVLKELEEEYATRGVELRQIDRGYRLQTRDKYSPWLARLVEERPARYSRALLETLAIIAYRQPVTRGDIEDIRGVAVSTDIIKTLQTRDWVREVGRREVPGRPALYGTTRAFLEYFNLSRLEDLPPLAELRDIGAISAELEQRAAAAGDAPSSDSAAAGASDSNGAEANGADEASGHLAAVSEEPEAEPTPAFADAQKSVD